MTRRIQIRPDAESDIEDAYLWYERRRQGLGLDFLLCIEEAIEKIRVDPEIYPILHKDIHRALIRRFPYGIFYRIEPETIIVLAVFHARRNPTRWQSRA